MTEIITHPELYKLDSAGKVRVWFMEQQGERYRTVAGIQGGALVSSEWTVAKATNVGRSNERCPLLQADFEVQAAYEHKLTREYHRTIAGAAGGAHFFKPMLAKEYEPAKFKPGYAQPKLDGMRCIATAAGLFSRQGKPISSCQHIVEALKPLFERDPDLVLDGELYNHELKHDFGKLMSLVKKASPNKDQAIEIAQKVQYHVYDMPSLDAQFYKRWKTLSDLIESLAGLSSYAAIQVVETHTIETSAQFDSCHSLWIAEGYEGSMYRANAAYEQKRSKHLLKRKDFNEDEYEVVPGGIKEGEGNWAGAAKSVQCWLPDADRSAGPNETNTFEAGIRGSYERGVALLGEEHKIVTVRHFGWTDTEIPKPRFGVVTAFWGDNRDF